MCSFDFKESGNRNVHVDALAFGGSWELCFCSVVNNILKSFYFCGRRCFLFEVDFFLGCQLTTTFLLVLVDFSRWTMSLFVCLGVFHVLMVLDMLSCFRTQTREKKHTISSFFICTIERISLFWLCSFTIQLSCV